MATTTSFKSVAELWHHRTSSTPDADAMYGRRGDGWYTLTWGECARRSRRISCGMLALGLEKGQRSSILCSTRPEWILVDMGVLCAAGATTTIYPSNTPPECQYILNDSESVFCFAENDKQLQKLIKVRAETPTVKHVIVIDGRGTDDGWALSLEELEAKGEEWDKANPGKYDEVAAAVGPEDLATLIYTAGTTGTPKGVYLVHDCWVFESEAIDKLGLMTPSDKQYLFLPLAHSFAKVLECGFIRAGTPTVVDGDIDSLVKNLSLVQPTMMGAVPRIFEKVYNKVVSGAKEGGALKYRIFRWSVEVGKECSKLRQQGREPAGLLALKERVADKLVFHKVKAIFGGRMRYLISGGAPLSREIAEFLHAVGVLVLEGYGLTESGAASFVNRPEKFKFGTVGLPLPGVSVKIGENGEILMGGRGIMRSYYKRPEETAHALDADGWLHTGDVGELDADGYLRITDRIKDLIKTAGGKYVAPQSIENALKAQSNLVSQVVVHGDQRPYCVALIAINMDTVSAWAKENAIEFSTYADLARNKAVEARIWQDVEELNKTRASYETIKKIVLLDHELSEATGELTPKMSVKRKVVEGKWKAALDAMYEGSIEKL